MFAVFFSVRLFLGTVVLCAGHFGVGVVWYHDSALVVLLLLYAALHLVAVIRDACHALVS